MTNTHLLKAEHLSLVRETQTILHDVSLEVRAQDFITIIGPNGAGKTILLKILMGLIAPDSGKIEKKPGLRIGYVPQRLVADHAIPISVHRFLTLRKKADADAMRRVADLTDTQAILHKPLYALSGGELQRALLARALLDQPELLILDEPAQNLDISGQLSFYKLLQQIYKNQRLSILMVSHDLHLVMASSKQVICLFHHVCCHGEPQMVAKDPAFISLFGDDMARLMAIYSHAHDHDHALHHDHDHDQETHV